jgi:hypothetical protein
VDSMTGMGCSLHFLPNQQTAVGRKWFSSRWSPGGRRHLFLSLSPLPFASCLITDSTLMYQAVEVFVNSLPGLQDSFVSFWQSTRILH